MPETIAVSYTHLDVYKRQAFTPDEEVGRGTEHFDLDTFQADYAYTIDGGHINELYLSLIHIFVDYLYKLQDTL